MNFYKILKIKKLGRGSPDFWTRLFAKHTGGGSAKPVIVELTGKIPLSFNTSDTKLHDWTIRGNNDVGKNMISVEDTTGQNPEVTITRRDELTGSIEAVAISGRRYSQIYWYPEFEEGQTYILSCYVNEVNEHGRLCFRKISGNQIVVNKWFTSTGAKTMEFTYTSESYPGGVYVSLMVNDSAATEAEINISELMLRKAGTSADFEPYQIGVGERTKNLLEITAESQTINGVSFAVDKQAGTVTATRESASSSDAILAIEIPDEVKGQNLYFSGCPSEGSANTYNVYTVDYVTTVRALQWDGTTPTVTDYGTSNNEVRYVEGHRSQIRLRIKAGYDAQNVVFKPMLRLANTNSEFIPYGYQIPLITMDAKTAEYVYRNNIFIGDSPLTEGESISKSSTGLDVKTITIGADDYPNKLITSLSNVPEMTIKYKSKGGS